ncbi:hypothetical protein INT47_002339 [Mucor saturninus]|uniref:DDRGK domain-containing protein 1 n=1 Tax=Mucor saturninus TaxID=64648 RepID=A0A8H7QN31_9FUNG|nr:hypothetical protein INT47_002339 [Mucor saturninus]
MVKDNGGTPLFVFIPLIVCIISIIFLLDIRRRRNLPIQFNTIHDEPDLVDDELIPDEEEEDLEEDDAGEGSSTAVRVRRVGTKRGEKLRRKEQMRQYREYMEQQRQIRKAQEEIYEEEFRRRKLEESIKRTDEMDKRKREKEKKAKADEKEGLKKQKNEEKDAKKRQARFDKYKEKVKKLVKETKLCQLNDLAKLLGLSKEEVVDILQQLCAQDMEFELCLWSGTDTFLFITRDDYNDFSQSLKGKGKISVEDGYI